MSRRINISQISYTPRAILKKIKELFSRTVETVELLMCDYKRYPLKGSLISWRKDLYYKGKIYKKIFSWTYQFKFSLI